jgi:putative transposase
VEYRRVHGELARLGVLRPIYQAATEDEAAAALSAFDQRWGSRYPMIAEMWRTHWERFIPFFAFAEPIRRIIYTTNSIGARFGRAGG